MTMPDVRHILLCDEVRQEVTGKSLLLGFFGVAPDVEIVISGGQLFVERLAFMIMLAPGAVDAQVSFQIADDAGKAVLQVAPELVQLGEAGRRSSLLVQTRGLLFPQEGEYQFFVVVDGLAHYRTTFVVRPASPGEMATQA